jgi:membrane-associated protease RseP (regulator of RpoE activity)
LALVVGVVVFVHEIGHFLVGCLFGVKAEIF